MSDKKVNKVVYEGETLIDLTEDSVTPETLAKGETAHDASGEQITGVLEATGGPFLPLKNIDHKAVSHYFEVVSGAEDPTSYLRINTSDGVFQISHDVNFMENVNVYDSACFYRNLHVEGTLFVEGGLQVNTISTSSGSEYIILVNKTKTAQLKPIRPDTISIGDLNNRYNTLYTKKVDATEHVITPKIRPPAVDGANHLRFITKDNVPPDASPDPLPAEWGGTGKNNLQDAVYALLNSARITTQTPEDVIDTDYSYISFIGSILHSDDVDDTLYPPEPLRMSLYDFIYDVLRPVLPMYSMYISTVIGTNANSFTINIERSTRFLILLGRRANTQYSILPAVVIRVPPNKSGTLSVSVFSAWEQGDSFNVTFTDNGYLIKAEFTDMSPRSAAILNGLGYSIDWLILYR